MKPTKMHPILLLLLLTLHLIPPSSPHGRLLDPPMRASVWRFAEFEHHDPPVNYDDDAFWCGNMNTQHNKNGGKCGVCGDDYSDATPRSHEDGGTYGRGIIVRNYTKGQTIPLVVELTGAHDGFFEFRLCARNSRREPETQACYDAHLLKLVNGDKSGASNVTRSPASRRKGLYRTSAVLPNLVTCAHCSIQWHYRTANNWGDCGNGTHAVGCGPQETFRGCADVAIR